MSNKTHNCSNCGKSLESVEVTKCDRCGSLLIYSVLQQSFLTEGEEGTFRGIARNVQWMDRHPSDILIFRIEQMDKKGNILGYIPVELDEVKYSKISGALADGDEVEVIGEVNRNRILSNPKKVFNLNTKSVVTVTYSNRAKLFGYGIIILFIVIFVFIAITVLLAFLGVWRFWN